MDVPHNATQYVADKILSINEKSTFSLLPLTDSAARITQDDEIFNRARLVNTAFFMQVILRDYVGTILGMVRDGSTWRLDPLEVTISDATKAVRLLISTPQVCQGFWSLSHTPRRRECRIYRIQPIIPVACVRVAAGHGVDRAGFQETVSRERVGSGTTVPLSPSSPEPAIDYRRGFPSGRYQKNAAWP